MRSRLSAFGLRTKGNRIRTCAAVLSSARREQALGEQIGHGVRIGEIVPRRTLDVTKTAQRMVQCDGEGAPALPEDTRSGLRKQGQDNEHTAFIMLSRITSISPHAISLEPTLDPSEPCVQLLEEGRVGSRKITTAACGRADSGRKECSTRARRQRDGIHR